MSIKKKCVAQVLSYLIQPIATRLLVKIRVGTIMVLMQRNLVQGREHDPLDRMVLVTTHSLLPELHTPLHGHYHLPS